MTMKVKAVEKLLKFDKNSAGTYRYVMSPEQYVRFCFILPRGCVFSLT